jgi:hypothetical protein
MRGWNETRFRAAVETDPETQQPVVWLRPHSKIRYPNTRLSRTLEAIDRSGRRAGRASAVVVVGCLACGAIPNSAIAPVGKAMAAVERFRLQPVSPAPLTEVRGPAPAQLVEASEIELHISLGPTGPVDLGRAVPAETAVSATVQPLHEVKEPSRQTDVIAAAAAASAAHPVEPGEAQYPAFVEGRDDVEEFLRFGSRELPRRLVETIVKAALSTEVDPIYLMALADKESSFRTDVKASTSSAEGLFQFIERTWLDTVRTFGPKHGLAAEAAAITLVDDKPTIQDEAERTRILQLRRDPYVAALMAAEMLRRDATKIGFKIGRQLNPTELYLAHFLGLQEAARFIAMKGAKRPKSASAAFPAAARANAAIFFERVKRGRRGLSVPEVYAKIDRMIDSRIELYRPVTTLATAAGSGV